MKKNNKINLIKHIVALALFTSILSKPVLATSKKPYDKQRQNAYFEAVYSAYPKLKATSIIASQLDINTYPTDPNWTYFPTLTESELDEIDRKGAISMQGFEKLEEFSPEEIEAILKEAESRSSTPPLKYERAPQRMAVEAPVEAKEARKEPRKREPKATQATMRCPQCHNGYASICGLKSHILKKHYTDVATTNDRDDNEYSPISENKKSFRFLCKFCNTPVKRSDCICHIARTCPVLHKQKNEENHENKQ